MPIALYSDSFGWGHLTRDAALARAWADSRKKDRLYWKVGESTKDVALRLAQGRKNVIISTWPGSVPLVPEGIGCSPEKTKPKMEKWLASAGERAKKESEFLKHAKISLVLSDITADAFYAAGGAGLPCLAVSNFGWSCIFKEQFPEWIELSEHLDGAYEQSALSFILPLHEPCVEFANKLQTPFLVRKMDADESKRPPSNIPARPRPPAKMLAPGAPVVPARLRPNEGPPFFAIVNFGKSTGDFKPPALPPGWQKLPDLPDDVIDGQNQYAQADALISKAAYGAASEAVQAGVPALLLERPHFIESRHIIGQMEENGWGWGVKQEQIPAMLLSWLRRPHPLRHVPDLSGAEKIVEKLDEF